MLLQCPRFKFYLAFTVVCSHLSVKKKCQDREIMRVLVDCCLQEKLFNKYYTVLALKLCSHDKNHKSSLQVCRLVSFIYHPIFFPAVADADSKCLRCLVIMGKTVCHCMLIDEQYFLYLFLLLGNFLCTLLLTLHTNLVNLYSLNCHLFLFIN